MRRQPGEPPLGWTDVLVILAVIAVLAGGLAGAASAAAPPKGPGLTEILDQAAANYAKQDWEAARRDYERATKLDIGSIPAWRGLGWSLWQLGEQDRAIQVWSDVIKVQPDDADTLLALAQAHASRENWQQAIDLYSQVLLRKPRRAGALTGRARIHLQLEQLEAAEADLRKAVKLAPDDFEAQFMLAQVLRSTERNDEAMTIYQRLARRTPEPRFLRQMADISLELDWPEEALKHYKANLAREPGNRGTILGMARAHARLHQYKPAISLLEGFLKTHPDDAKIREEVARFASGAGDHARAQKHLRVLVQEHPEEIKWRVSLAQSLRNGGRLQEAEEGARAVLADDPRNVAALELLLHLDLLAGRKDDVLKRLEQLAEVEPTARRLNRLATGYIRRGDEHLARERTAEAQKAFAKAAAVFQQSADLEPFNAEARQGVITAHRLAGNYARAIEAATEVIAWYPTVEWAWRELYEAHLGLGDYARASALAREWHKRGFAGIRVRHEMARVRYKQGEHDAAIADLRELLAQPIRPGVPVLLYHGLSEASPADDTMPVKNFRDQMQALKREGYQPISVHELLAFHRDGGPLPPKPVLITFDDARADSFRYADPVLKEVGFQATMFTPVAEVGKHGEYNAVWNTIREMRATKRWDVQCHSYVGHVLMPVAADARSGVFLANRQWLEEKKRLETRREFAERLEADYSKCATELKRELPGIKLAGYAYPFGELGQKSLSNERTAVETNLALATKYYGIGFVQDPGAQATRLSPAAALPRFEVPWDFSGKDLITHLRRMDAYTSTQIALADLYSWEGRYAEAKALYEDVAKNGGAQDVALLTRRGRVDLWEGDFQSARRHLDAAAEGDKSEHAAMEAVAQLDRYRRSRLTVDGWGMQDNEERSSLGAGPRYKVHFGDRVSLSSGWRYRILGDEAFEADPSGTGAPVELRASGDEFEAELEYRRDWRTAVSLSGGVARFKDESPTPQFAAESESFPLGALAINLPLGSAADVAFRGTHGYVSSAGAVLDGLTASSLDGQLEVRPLRNTSLSSRYTQTRYGDGNTRGAGTVTLMQRLAKSPELEIGYRYRTDDARERNPYFYTPEKFVGHDAVLKLVAGPYSNTTYEIEGAIGSGSEAGGGATLQTSILGTIRLEIADRFSVFFSGGQNQSATYESLQASGGLWVAF